MKYHEKTDIEKVKFTPREVSERLGVPYWMVWRLSRMINFDRKGKISRFTEGDIMKMQEALKHNP
jgi:hypothetical protein